MAGRVEGVAGGIRRLRDLLDGEHSGALHYDLITRGFRPELVGSFGHSWYDLRVLVEWLPNTGTSALFRSLNPDTWMWMDIDSQLLAKIATTMSEHRFISAAQALGEKVPEDWHPVRYGPPSTEPKEPEEPVDRDAAALAIANSIRASLAAA